MTDSQAQSRLASKQDDNRNVLHTDGPDTVGDIVVPDSDIHDSTNTKKDDTVYEYEEMVQDGRRFLCKLPIVYHVVGNPDANYTLSKQEEEKELTRANDRGWELLQGMQGNCVYYWSGWWSYRYCYGQGVKQFHQLPPSQGIPAYPPVEDPGVKGFTLGSVEESLPQAEKDVAESNPAVSGKALGHLESRGDSRYLVQQLEGGTVCDLTGKERRIEIQVRHNTCSKMRTVACAKTSYSFTAIQRPTTRYRPSRRQPLAHI